ncbi:putative N-acetylmannosaminyltransferase [Brochothrix campestris FSL F6-1037]|uniref:Putative N-acetylmannosaminyltransferase n=1 Tax=Brochothrix campestris FSL F6-1037 TaxID=1265861 RepID=W7D436_9LIST|nr:putative N-acetylmannosaminyltransferase [Brochothrix campestris FSL F6-1037]
MKKVGRTVTVLGIPFYRTTKVEMVATLTERVRQQQRTFVVTANPEIVMKARGNQQLNEAIMQADYVTADGIGIVKATQHLADPLPERVTGFELFSDLLTAGNKQSWSLYLVGSSDEVINKTVQVIADQYPNLQLKGYHSGFFDTEMERTAIQTDVIASQADLVFVAMGSPYQEVFITEMLSQLQKGLLIGIGGSFDVFSGTVKRAPLIWQKFNLEWAYRVLTQPSRIWRMKDLIRFYIATIKR